MLSSISLSTAVVVVVASLLAGVVVEAQDTSNLTIPAAVGLPQKVLWCLAERNTCPLLCGGPAFLQLNNCVGANLPDYDCLCSNGTAPANIDDYIGSIPNSICIATFEQCRHDHPGSEACPKCGTLNPTDVPNGVASSTIVSSTATATPTPTPADDASVSAALASATASPGAGVPGVKAVGAGGLAVGVLAVLGGLL